MIELGKYQVLEVCRKTDFGLYLCEPGRADKNHTILLPMKEVPEGTGLNDKLTVFVYKDSEDREIATTAKVPLTAGELAVLKVKEVTKIGAFLDWGLSKDLLLPFKEQTAKVKEGDEILVSLYVDKSNRLCATMKVYDLLSTNSHYKKGDMVSGIVYDIIDAFGTFVAVDNMYSALIPRNQLFNPLNIGDRIQARVIDVREDGKLTLSMRDKSYIQMNYDADTILDMLKKSGGYLPYHDKTDAEIIRNEFHMSKKAFKRAIAKLYKDSIISIEENGIRLTSNNT